jgi:hypothetical protein
MRKIAFKSWIFEVDSELTQKAYAMKSIGSADECSCEYCENYRNQRKSVFPEEIHNLFAELGIDYKKEDEVSEYVKLENGLHKYVGEFYFAGKILSGAKFYDGNSIEIELTETSENFSIAFGEKKSSTWITFMFESNILWLLAEKLDL